MQYNQLRCDLARLPPGAEAAIAAGALALLAAFCWGCYLMAKKNGGNRAQPLVNEDSARIPTLVQPARVVVAAKPITRPNQVEIGPVDGGEAVNDAL
jgi:hypothetical protein